ncbi:hypothetical protein [Bilophila wadsworthia]|uniref:hypothetical protein n=1 Tax=Bilophila wadsworthia TaxID=35833 RepID=UPI000497654C|nr:hypothetical protein [Bilophila wadsworthia]
MSSRVFALIGAALLVASGWIVHLYGKLELQEARYEARIAVLAEEVSQKDKARADAVAAAERAAREKLEKETARVAALSAELSDARKKLAKERQTFDARLQKVAVAARHNCAGLSRDWVRLYNEALGLAGSGGGPGSQDADPAGTAAPPGQTGPAGTGVRGDALATPEDVLAHVRDYGGYCRGLEIQLGTLARVVSP